VIGGICGIGIAGLIAAVVPAIRPWFGADAQVYGQAMLAWWWFVGMQPFAGVVFALDGVFIGAGDVKYMRNLTLVAALGGFLPSVWLALWFDLGLGGVWAGLTLFIMIRLVGLLLRLRGDRWAVTGSPQ
jgi:Na+-driven multidrug efflux pump